MCCNQARGVWKHQSRKRMCYTAELMRCSFNPNVICHAANMQYGLWHRNQYVQVQRCMSAPPSAVFASLPFYCSVFVHYSSFASLFRFESTSRSFPNLILSLAPPAWASPTYTSKPHYKDAAQPAWRSYWQNYNRDNDLWSASSMQLCVHVWACFWEMALPNLMDFPNLAQRWSSK